MKKCAICGRPILPTYELCKDCKKYKDEPWAKELIKMEKHYIYMESRERETPFSEYPAEYIESIKK